MVAFRSKQSTRWS